MSRNIMANNRKPQACFVDIYKAFAMHQKIVIVGLNTVLSILMLTVNSLLVIALKKTKQLSVQSIHLTYIMCVTDILFGVVGLPSKSIMVLLGKDLNCTVTTFMNFSLEVFLVKEVSLIVLIIIDRYLHIKYLSEYGRVFSSRRYKICVAAMLSFSVLLAGLSTVLSVTLSVNKGKMVLTSVGCLFLIIGGIIYHVSYKLLQKHREQGATLSANASQITKIAKLYLILLIIMKVIPFALTLVIQNIKRIEAALLIQYLYNVMNGYAVVNALVFVRVNRKVKLFFNRKAREIFRMSPPET